MRRRTSPSLAGTGYQDRVVRHRCRTCHRLREDCVERVEPEGSWDCRECLERLGQMRLTEVSE